VYCTCILFTGVLEALASAGIERGQTDIPLVLSDFEYCVKLFTMLLKSTGNLVGSDRVQILFGIKNMVRVLDRDIKE